MVHPEALPGERLQELLHLSYNDSSSSAFILVIAE